MALDTLLLARSQLELFPPKTLDCLVAEELLKVVSVWVPAEHIPHHLGKRVLLYLEIVLYLVELHCVVDEAKEHSLVLVVEVLGDHQTKMALAWQSHEFSRVLSFPGVFPFGLIASVQCFQVDLLDPLAEASQDLLHLLLRCEILLVALINRFEGFVSFGFHFLSFGVKLKLFIFIDKERL